MYTFRKMLLVTTRCTSLARRCQFGRSATVYFATGYQPIFGAWMSELRATSTQYSFACDILG